MRYVMLSLLQTHQSMPHAPIRTIYPPITAMLFSFHWHSQPAGRCVSFWIALCGLSKVRLLQVEIWRLIYIKLDAI